MHPELYQFYKALYSKIEERYPKVFYGCSKYHSTYIACIDAPISHENFYWFNYQWYKEKDILRLIKLKAFL